MNKRQKAILSSLLLFTIVACSDKNTPASSLEPTALPSVPSASSEAIPPAASATMPASPSATEPVPSSTESEATEVKKTYRMNSAYRIVPIDKETTNSRVVLLTFDDGPKDELTLNPILDILDQHQAKAIFFVNGYRVQAKPELLEEIDSRGQVIGNHSWDHIDLKKQSPEAIKEQIENVQAIVEDLTGKAPIFFRPPHGSSNDSVREIAKANHMLFMTWSNGSLDWDLNKVAKEKRPQAVIDHVMEQLHEGSNILMHELPWTAEALDQLLTQLEEKGYTFVDPNAIDPEL